MQTESNHKIDMIRPKLLLLFVSALLFDSCKTDSQHNYAIKDFRKSLRPFLTKIVSENIVMASDSSLRFMATDNELIYLVQSEHPVLRASAFREILDRKSFNHFDMLMNHLDDTAIVRIDEGEFGINTKTVSDDILHKARWKTNDEKNKTIDLVLTKHNYLRSAFLILQYIQPQKKYYSFIKTMATRPRRVTDDGYELDFNDIEYALYGLSKFKVKEDVQIIKNLMLENAWRLSYVSFRLMREHPDTAYFAVLQKYHRRRFYKFSGNRRDGFSGFIPDRADPEDFISALVAQQNDKSALLLDTVLAFLPMQNCMPDKETIINNVMEAIWKHPCPAYTRLRKRIKTKVEEISKGVISISVDPPIIPIDTPKANIRWSQGS